MVAIKQKNMKIALFLKPELEETDIATYLISKMNEHDLELDQDSPDIVLFVGGDGTLLRAVQTYIEDIYRIKFIGINEGSLGFYSDYVIDEVDQLFEDIKNNEYEIYTHHLLEAEFNNRKIYAVNEIRIENPFHTLTSEVSIEGKFLEKFTGNGLVISSPNGSSAYNKSLGGAVVFPGIECLQLTEIAPINNRVYHSLNSPLIIPSNFDIEFNCMGEELVIGYDHLTISTKVDRMVIYNSELNFSIIYKKDHSYAKQLNEAFIDVNKND